VAAQLAAPQEGLSSVSKYGNIKPISVDARSKVLTLFAPSNTGIVGSNLT
jgi:hypothetical protein